MARSQDPSQKGRKTSLIGALQVMFAMVQALFLKPEPQPQGAVSLRALEAQRREEAAQKNIFLDDAGVIEMSGIMTTVGLIVGAILGFALLAAFADTWFDFTRDLVENLTNADTGNAVGDSITSVFALVVAVLSPVAYVGLILGVLALPAIPRLAARRGRR